MSAANAALAIHMETGQGGHDHLDGEPDRASG